MLTQVLDSASPGRGSGGAKELELIGSLLVEFDFEVLPLLSYLNGGSASVDDAVLQVVCFQIDCLILISEPELPSIHDKINASILVAESLPLNICWNCVEEFVLNALAQHHVGSEVTLEVAFC